MIQRHLLAPRVGVPTVFALLAFVSWPAHVFARADAVPRDDISITIVRPAPTDTAPVADTLDIVVTVAFTYQPAATNPVVASVEGRTMPLVYSAPWWTGALSLAGVPRGTHTLTIVATDVNGTQAEAAGVFVLDRPPVITVIEPPDQLVAGSAVHLLATCSDDDPAGCQSFKAYKPYDASTEFASGHALIDKSLPLAASTGIRFQATDSAGQIVWVDRAVFVEPSTQIVEVARLGGSVLDAASDRILYLVPAGSGYTLVVRDRATGADTTVASLTAAPHAAFLTPAGAIYIAHTSTDDVVYDWRGGAPISLGTGASDLAVSGDYAVYGSSSVILILRDVRNGKNIAALPRTSPHQSVEGMDVAANGDVVYSQGYYNMGAYSAGIYRYRAGTSTLLTTSNGPCIPYPGGSSAFCSEYPVTDGVNVVYTKWKLGDVIGTGQIAMLGASGPEIVLNAGLGGSPGRDYQVNGGWVAFTNGGQVWVRAPDGTLTQRSFLNSRSYVEALDPSGNVIFRNDTEGHLYLSKPGQPAVEIAASAGRAFWTDKFYVATGYSLFELLSGTPSDPCSYAISPLVQTAPGAGGPGTITVATDAGCAYNVASHAPWVTILNGEGARTGPGTAEYVVAPIPAGQTRTGTIVVANQDVTITQTDTACIYYVSAATVRVPAAGAEGDVSMYAGLGCGWAAYADAPWLAISPTSGTVSATVHFVAQPNFGRSFRSTALHIGDRQVTFRQIGRGAVDFNGDGLEDLLWHNNTTGQTVVWYMSGSTFLSQALLPTVPATDWRTVAAADFNGDERTDILWRNAATGQNVVWLMDGATFVSQVSLPTVANTNWQIVAAADFNGDGKMDLVWRNIARGQNVVWYLDGTTFVSQALLPGEPDTTWRIVAAADFNRDGKPDLLWRNSSTGQNRVWYMNGTTFVSEAWLLTVADTNWQVGMAVDVDGDGQTDIVWRHGGSGWNVVWYLNGVTFVGQTALPTVIDPSWGFPGPPYRHIWKARDFNGDDSADVLWRNAVTGQNVVWLMNRATFVSQVLLAPVADPNWQIVGAADFNGDGKPDLVWRNASTGWNVVWLMDGTTFVSQVLLPPVPDTNWQIVAVADFNEDDKPDLVWRNISTGWNVVWLMNGTTFVSQTLLPPVPDVNWQIVAAADFDGDFKPDLVWRNASTGMNVIWLMSGTTFMSQVLLMTVADTAWQIAAVEDFDGDFRPDLVWRNEATGQNALWLMNGTTCSSDVGLPSVADVNWQIR